ncbi:MAG: T9SS type A sorting domain-containing protein, partial [Bacteroidales bacterium]|nr:T9SS type A sorting domain-containing protein [Bacteroidales bacterium]
REFTILTNGLMAAIWIEGIGNYEGLYYPFHTNTAENWGNTRCYIYNGDLLYSNYSHGGNNCIDPLMGVENISEDNSITLYPNPTSKDVNISSENIINSIEVFNSFGQRVYQEETKAKDKTIEISSLSKGVYIIVANTDKGYIRKKLIKN